MSESPHLPPSGTTQDIIMIKSNTAFGIAITATAAIIFLIGLCSGCNEGLSYDDSMSTFQAYEAPATGFAVDVAQPEVCNWDVFYAEESTCQSIFDNAGDECSRVRAICTIEPEIVWKDGELRDCQAANQYWDAVIVTLEEYAPNCLEHLN